MYIYMRKLTFNLTFGAIKSPGVNRGGGDADAKLKMIMFG
jgi:hypothetical protein